MQTAKSKVCNRLVPSVILARNLTLGLIKLFNYIRLALVEKDTHDDYYFTTNKIIKATIFHTLCFEIIRN